MSVNSRKVLNTSLRPFRQPSSIRGSRRRGVRGSLPPVAPRALPFLREVGAKHTVCIVDIPTLSVHAPRHVLRVDVLEVFEKPGKNSTAKKHGVRFK